jgi:hypothetical protein
VTNDDGRFVIKGVEPGGYRLSVSRLGFVTEEYGQRKPEAQGATLTLRPGQELKDLLFRLVPSAVISGKILDEDGERCRRFQYLPSSRVTRKESESFLARTGRKPMISANTAFTVLRQVDIS